MISFLRAPRGVRAANGRCPDQQGKYPAQRRDGTADADPECDLDLGITVWSGRRTGKLERTEVVPSGNWRSWGPESIVGGLDITQVLVAISFSLEGYHSELLSGNYIIS